MVPGAVALINDDQASGLARQHPSVAGARPAHLVAFAADSLNQLTIYFEADIGLFTVRTPGDPYENVLLRDLEIRRGHLPASFVSKAVAVDEARSMDAPNQLLLTGCTLGGHFAERTTIELEVYRPLGPVESPPLLKKVACVCIQPRVGCRQLSAGR